MVQDAGRINGFGLLYIETRIDGGGKELVVCLKFFFPVVKMRERGGLGMCGFKGLVWVYKRMNMD